MVTEEAIHPCIKQTATQLSEQKQSDTLAKPISLAQHGLFVYYKKNKDQLWLPPSWQLPLPAPAALVLSSEVLLQRQAQRVFSGDPESSRRAPEVCV